MRLRRVLLAGSLAAACLALVLGPAPSGAIELPPGVTETVVFSGLEVPVVVRFSPDGRVFVGEKTGVVKVFDGFGDTTPTVFADLRTNVFNGWDRGLLGLALHPDFPATPSVYVLYTHDAPIGGTAPRWGTIGGSWDDCPTPPGVNGDGCVVSGRLSRLTASGNVASGPEEVLVEDWCQQYPSHTVGTVAFGADGALYAGAGDGANYNFVDYGQDGNPLNPCGDPPAGVGGTQTPPTAEGGALRAQDVRTTGDPAGLDGSIIRVDPATGAALPSNPFAFSGDANMRRVVAYGMRNPFRFAVRPGTSELWIGDVGWGSWEEINVTAGADTTADNFGWPCYEGSSRQGGYDAADLSLCESLYGTPGAVVAPRFAYSHSSTVVPGESCPSGGSSLAGVAFAPAVGVPDKYKGALFFADYSRDCIWAMRAGGDGNPNPALLETFAAQASNPVDLQFGPDGSLYYVDVEGGTIRRLAFAGQGDQTPPTVQVTQPTAGATLTGSVALAATATDAGGMAGVQFLLDDAPIGVEDTTAPFEATLDTTTLRNGTHTVGAVARDLAGNTATAVPVQVTVANAGGTWQYVSDLPLLAATNGWGPVELDRSNAEQAAGDGGPITIGGVVYEKGLGVHALSEVRVAVPAGCTGFAADVGVDDEIGDRGSLRFRVLADGVEVADSGVRTGTDAALPLSADVTGRAELLLRAEDGGDGRDFDHGDWADARFTCGGTANTAPVPTIASPDGTTRWTVDELISFSGSAVDAEDGPLPAEALSWTLALEHCPSNCHSHVVRTWAEVAEGSFTAPDHEYPSHLELRLTATDSRGASATATVRLDPRTVDLRFESEPAGLRVVVGSEGEVTPFTRTVIAGSTSSVSAESPQTLDGRTYAFASWSDGGAATHLVVASADATLTATFVPANGAPTARATATPSSGPAPLTVDFDGSASSDPDPGDTLAYAWDLDGDGAYDDATGPTARTTYTTPGTVTARLRVTDGAGNVATSDPLEITASNTPPRPTIDSPSAGTRWAVGEVVAFAGGADDDQDGTLAPSRLDWELILRPCGACAPQTLQQWSGTASGTFTAPDAPYPATLELQLTATDAQGASAVATRPLEPRTVTLSFATSPTGLSLDVGGSAPAPFDRTATVGSSVQVAAPSPQTLGPDTYDFASWSDGAAAAHTITVPAAPATYTATYTARAGACPAGQWRAEYFTNRTLSGSPALTRCEQAIDYSWGSGSPAPGIGTNNFSVRWTGRFSFLGGSTTFAATTNDGMRVRLDSALVIDQWRDQATTTYLALRTVAAGAHDVSVEFYDRSGTAVARASWREGLVAAYNFNESTGGTVLDRSANGNAGTISGATRTSSGRNGRAVSFDGVNDWVTVADAGTLDLSTGMTLEAWVYPTSLDSATRAVLAKEATGTLRYGLYGNTSSRPGARVDVAGGRTATGTAQLPLNTWTHLAATFDGSTLRLYVNGVEVSSVAAAGSIAASTGALRIGGHAVASEWFAGRVDDVRVYSRALSAAEIQADRDTAVP